MRLSSRAAFGSPRLVGVPLDLCLDGNGIPPTGAMALPMSFPQPDFADCADEPIRVPGAIQPHGWLVATHADGRIAAFSENWVALAASRDAAGVARLLAEPLAALAPGLPDLSPGDGPTAIGTCAVGGQTVDATAHRVGELTLFEFEPASPQSGSRAPIYTLAHHFFPHLQQAASVDELCAIAVQELKRLTGFGRCLAYRFNEQGDGEVLAERIDAGYDSYDGHHFPASDIPAQARALYCLNHIRLIPDANYRPVALLGTDPAWDPRALDLSQAALRSVSPIHLEYMRNMRTLASMSVSLVVRGRLWGLVSCHDHAPHHLPWQTRVACEHLGRLLSLQIEAKEDNAEVATRLELRKLTLEIVSHLADSDATLQRLVEHPGPLMQLAGAGGAAVVLDDQCWSAGRTPTAAQVHALSRWIGQRGGEVYANDALAAHHPPAADYLDSAAGVMAISISEVHHHMILWFRPEIEQTIRWAGEPTKPSTADGRLHPRRSFASWQELVRGRSLRWSASAEAAVLELRRALLGIVLRRAQERAEVATELTRVNQELEAFSYTVSHDLRAPMRHISGYADLVLDTEGKVLSEAARRYLGQVKEASAYAGQLVDALLDFSRMGRSALKRSSVPTELLVDDLVRELSNVEAGRAIEWTIVRPLPALYGDPFLLQVAVRNLLGNAVKYSRGRAPARIRIAPIARQGESGLEVTDNGVGFQMKYVAKLFGVFQRLHQAEDFEGTGIGLANVRRIVERHGGQVWARGEPDRGATFGFTVPDQPAADPPPSPHEAS
jgi:light-regulated signal transduction histidine kinase (bacteriophytochrome)